MRGRVVYCGLTGSAGLAALVEHEGGLYSRYTHLASLSVRVNQRLTADRVLGRVGMSGEVTEPVLGFAVERRAEASDEWRVDDAEPLDFRALLGNVWGVSSSTAFELYDEDEELESES
jgi:murein DD-endopeptidase MepM/ murein hydrolase activator NlpD